MAAKKKRNGISNGNGNPFNAAVRTDTYAAMRKLQLIGRMAVAYEQMTRVTIVSDPDARAVLELREVLGRLVKLNHDSGAKYAAMLLGRLGSARYSTHGRNRPEGVQHDA